MKIKFCISYDGTNYSGWQVQKNAKTVQEVFQDAVEAVYGERYSVTGCSRTDAGVHANSYCCAVEVNGDCGVNIPFDRLPVVFNRYLPDDVSVLFAEAVSDEFHPRYDVVYKEYEYVIHNSEIKNPFFKNRVYMYPKRLDECVMNEAAQRFVGTFDFAGFMSSGSSVEDTVRTIKYFNVKRVDDRVIINVAADGFLYNMVRILVGTLIEVSEGKIDVNGLDALIASKDRKKAGFTAPASGLYLNKIVY
ncbi:MAG: tRNA pseudouridine(38-40) synthase TruA [Clostridia bacterium]|nr:tRNA pseudouridine(38-40) synthase TruA [Clostridia bacterium]